MAEYFSIRWVEGKVRMLDQRQLPHHVEYLDFTTHLGVAQAIRDMVIRGAPAIGAAAAFALALAAYNSAASTAREFLFEMEQAGEAVKAARPTAVNLAWAVARVLQRLNHEEKADLDRLRVATLNEAQAIADEDARLNRQMGLHGLAVVPHKARIIHHCNTGALATVDYGTALGVIRTAHEHNRQVHVYVDETRPRLQGARLTAWELENLGIPFTVIVDGASGYFMRQGKIDLCLVGCDRVAANGDTANKIGTYNLALVAQAHHVPFYVVGPTSTVDLNLQTGDLIPIEERSPEEITTIGNYAITPQGASASNPAFDITPAGYITGIITENGIAYPPFEQTLHVLCHR